LQTVLKCLFIQLFSKKETNRKFPLSRSWLPLLCYWIRIFVNKIFFAYFKATSAYVINFSLHCKKAEVANNAIESFFVCYGKVSACKYNSVLMVLVLMGYLFCWCSFAIQFQDISRCQTPDAQKCSCEIMLHGSFVFFLDQRKEQPKKRCRRQKGVKRSLTYKSH